MVVLALRAPLSDLAAQTSADARLHGREGFLFIASSIFLRHVLAVRSLQTEKVVVTWMHPQRVKVGGCQRPWPGIRTVTTTSVGARIRRVCCLDGGSTRHSYSNILPGADNPSSSNNTPTPTRTPTITTMNDFAANAARAANLYLRAAMESARAAESANGSASERQAALTTATSETVSTNETATASTNAASTNEATTSDQARQALYLQSLFESCSRRVG